MTSKSLWGIELHFKNGDVAFIDNGSLHKMQLTDIKENYLSYSTKPELMHNKYCSEVYLKISKHILGYNQKNGVCCEDGLTIIEMINNSSIEVIRLIDGNGEGEDIMLPWDRGPATVFNTLQRQRFEMGDLVIEIGGKLRGQNNL